MINFHLAIARKVWSTKGKKEKEQVLKDASSKMNSLINSFTSDISATTNKLKDDW